MRLRSGWGHVRAVLGMAVLVFAIAACSGQPPQSRGYGLGGPAPAQVAPGSPHDFTADAGDVVHFRADSAVLSPKARATLRKQVRWLNQHPQYRVIVAGHADEDGTRQRNLALGAQRALAVKRFLKRAGLRTDRIHTVSYGQERPIAACHDATCRSQNRRAQTVLSGDTTARD